MRRRKTGLVGGMRIVAAVLVFSAVSVGCGGGGGSGGAPPAIPVTEITGTVSGTLVMAIDENGEVAGRDDTAGRSPESTTIPPRYRFRMDVPRGHQYHFYFIHNEGTSTERIVPLHFPNAGTNVLAIGGTVPSLDFGHVDTSGVQATAGKDPFTVSGVTPGPETGPPTIRVEGYKYFVLLDDYDGRKRYRVQVQVKDAAGNVLTDGTLLKGVKVYTPTGAEIPSDGNFNHWNGAGTYFDTDGTKVLIPTSDIEMYLSASPGTLGGGFYTVVITDNNGNLFTSKLHYETPAEVSKPVGLSPVVNADNSITLSWTNPAGISAPAYPVYVYVVSDDGNGDGLQDLLLLVRRSAPTNSYTIPVNFVQSALTGKTGLKWMVEIRQQTTSPVTFPDGTSSTAQFYRVRSAQAILSISPQPVGFSQADLTGTWDGIQFGMGSSERGWNRFGATIDGSGSVTATYVLDSNGNTTLPAPGSFTSIISGIGVVTEGGANGDPDFHGQMSSNKLLVIGKKGSPGGTSAGIMVFRKRTGTAFNTVDLANKTFTYHQLLSGTDNTWERGAGTTNASSAVTLTSIVTPSGAQIPPPGEVGTFAVNSAGIVTDTGDSTWYGLMTDDKKVIFAIQTRDTGVYGFMVITITGQTYVQSDFAGIYNFSGIRNTVPTPAWSYGAFSVDTAGNGVYLSYTDNFGNPVPGNFFLSLSASGITTSLDASHHGQLSYNKDLWVRTNTSTTGRYGLAIGFK